MSPSGRFPPVAPSFPNKGTGRKPLASVAGASA